MHSFLTSQIPDIPITTDVLQIHPNPSIGIEEVRLIQNFVSKKPTQGDKNTVLIHDAHLLTLPAQHALLKTLEEPPEHTQIYLVTPYPDSLLPTVISRVQNISISNSISNQSASYSPSSYDLLIKLLSAKVGERLALLDSADFTRDSALKFLGDLEIILHQHLNKQPNLPPLEFKRGSEGKFYELIGATRTYLKSNVNLKLALDHLALNLI